jgi:hypothetical protein
MLNKASILFIAIFSIAAAATADATPRNGRRTAGHANDAVVVCNDRGCSDRPSTARVDARTRAQAYDVDANGNTVIVGRRPAGCPHRFCGCEASLYVFGKIRPELNLASNWIRMFPRTAPAPGMAAARSGHVMVLMSHVEGQDWLVHDGNSGNGRTREHVRSIRGYVIVDPHGSRSAER